MVKSIDKKRDRGDSPCSGVRAWSCLSVHYSLTPNPVVAEKVCLHSFKAYLSIESIELIGDSLVATYVVYR